jgi:hypothetical protein
MRKGGGLNIQKMLKEAESSENQEVYFSIDKNRNCRIGVIARSTRSKSPRFFIEVIVCLFPNYGKVDLQSLKREIAFLEELHKRNYSLTCQDGNYISCEMEVSINNLAEEYRAIKMLKA